MRLFHVIASRRGEIVLDRLLRAKCPRGARSAAKEALGLQSLSGVVMSIAEHQPNLIRDVIRRAVSIVDPYIEEDDIERIAHRVLADFGVGPALAVPEHVQRFDAYASTHQPASGQTGRSTMNPNEQ